MKKVEEYVDIDETASSRKEDHITLAFQSQQDRLAIDRRFYYEPMLSPHKSDYSILECTFAGFRQKLPMWVSSMTGGTEKANLINKNLSKACGEYGIGMGLGSCRSLLFSDEYFHDFDVKDNLGEFPLFANLGIAQVEILAEQNDWVRISNMVQKLRADGLIIHVNPLQEWLQPEGDRFAKSPIETVEKALDNLDIPIIVKEVGQGMGPQSLDRLMRLPLAGVEFAASGGTNFSTIELFRADAQKKVLLENATKIGHTAEEMVLLLNHLNQKNKTDYKVSDVIISGGVRDFLDSYYLRNLCEVPSISGHASQFLKYALEGYDALCAYIETQREGLMMANSFLTLKTQYKDHE